MIIRSGHGHKSEGDILWSEGDGSEGDVVDFVDLFVARNDIPGLLQHLMACGIEKRDIFLDEV